MRLSRHQLALIRNTARSLPHAAREGFLIALAQRLADNPSDAAVAEAVNITLDRTITTSAYLCDAKPKDLA